MPQLYGVVWVTGTTGQLLILNGFSACLQCFVRLAPAGSLICFACSRKRCSCTLGEIASKFSALSSFACLTRSGARYYSDRSWQSRLCSGRHAESRHNGNELVQSAECRFFRRREHQCDCADALDANWFVNVTNRRVLICYVIFAAVISSRFSFLRAYDPG